MFCLFRGEKSVLFYIGLIVLGYSVSQFFWAGWQIALPFFTNSSSTPDIIGIQWFYYVPSIVQGIIWLIIGLYIMKVGVKKDQSLPES